MDRLKIGDNVMWRGAWGKELPKEAKVKSIELCANGNKHGGKVKSVAWETVTSEKRSVSVVLENGFWAYGYQLSPIEN